MAVSRAPLASLSPARVRTARPWRARPRVNWQFFLGAVIVAAAAVVAVFGPDLAPRDPMQENYILLDTATGRFVKPPYAPGQMPDFPFGADRWGRDIFSMLLWAVRPTLILVLMVATVRLTVGTLVGLAAGWFGGRLARALDSLIGVALSVPVLFVALAVIAAVGVNLGLWAFILGLSVTGWGEVARLVRSQTRAVRGQPFIEAAHALGGGDGYIVGRHVLPQIMPLLWNLLALEASSALLVTAGLGFIGYFVNAIWISFGDFNFIHATGRPELGQMLGGARDLRQQPWTMLFSGAVVAALVLGFNLLGEGLRLALAPGAGRRHTALGRALSSAGHWLEDNFYGPLAVWRAIDTAVPALVLAVIMAGGVLYWRAETQAESRVAISVPGGHQWASERHDAHGTAWTQARGPRSPVLAWTHTHPVGFSGGPAIAAGGTLYAATLDGQLHALAPSGQVMWTTTLPVAPVGAPALGASGTLYMADQEGGLMAVSPQGALLWTIKGNGLGALSGPITTPDETIVYVTEVAVVAAQASGQLRWAVPLPSYSYSYAHPRLSTDGQRLFFEDVTLDLATGAVLVSATPESADRYVVGVNGRLYLHRQAGLVELPPDGLGSGAALGHNTDLTVRLDLRTLNLGGRAPANAGVLDNGGAWFLFGSPFEYDRIVWVGPGAAVGQPMDYPYPQGWLAGIDGDHIVYQCGVIGGRQPGLECRANPIGSNQAVWQHHFDDLAPPVGAALAAGRLYVATLGGSLYALEEQP